MRVVCSAETKEVIGDFTASTASVKDNTFFHMLLEILMRLNVMLCMRLELRV
jgi:hypothetical protein